MARPKKIVEAVEETVEDMKQVDEIVQKKVQNKTVAMVRDETYPEPRTAEVHAEEVEEWAKFGWIKK